MDTKHASNEAAVESLPCKCVMRVHAEQFVECRNTYSFECYFTWERPL